MRTDAIGNFFARWKGSEDGEGLPAVGTGSHIDAIPHSGKFDGTVGVLGGLEAIRALQRRGVSAAAVVGVVDVYVGGADAVWDWVFGIAVAGGVAVDGTGGGAAG